MFFVTKKDGIHIRMIVDARRANRHFRPPPHVALCTAEGITRIEMELPDDVDPWTPDGVRMLSEACSALGILDVKDCFHRMVIPLWLSKYFCFKQVRAKDVGLSGCLVDGCLLGPMDLVYPCCRCLPMGFPGLSFSLSGLTRRCV
jgi:hypothetical protein